MSHKPVKLLFLGSGAAFTSDAENFHSNMLLMPPSGRNLLIDCGTDIRFSLAKQQLTFLEIQGIYISHLHFDHAGGLEYLALVNKFGKKENKPDLYFSEYLTKDLIGKISGGLNTLEGEIANLNSYFKTHIIPLNGRFEWESIPIQLVQTIHAMNGFCLAPSFGLLLEIHKKIIFITTDTQFCPNQIIHLFEKADVIFHDCETKLPRSGVHAHFNELCNLDPKIKSKMWLYHFNSGELPDAKKEGFKGFVQCGQCFEF